MVRVECRNAFYSLLLYSWFQFFLKIKIIFLLIKGFVERSGSVGIRVPPFSAAMTRFSVSYDMTWQLLPRRQGWLIGSAAPVSSLVIL